MAKNFAGLEDAAKGVGVAVGGAIGGAIIAASIAAGTELVHLIDAIADAGDRAESLRIPINILQALSVAADQARVPTTLLNSAMDQFTKVSKESTKDADEFYKALSNIGPAWVKAFQARRHRLIDSAC